MTASNDINSGLNLLPSRHDEALRTARERIQNGEGWDSVAASLGLTSSGLRERFARRGIEIPSVGRGRRKMPRGIQEVAEKMLSFDIPLSRQWLAQPLLPADTLAALPAGLRWRGSHG